MARRIPGRPIIRIKSGPGALPKGGGGMFSLPLVMLFVFLESLLGTRGHLRQSCVEYLNEASEL
jgi:hypothetical protein